MQFIIIGYYCNSQMLIIFLFYHFHKCSANFHPMEFGIHKQIMDIRRHDPVIHYADHANEFIAIPSGIYCFKSLHCSNELIRIMAG